MNGRVTRVESVCAAPRLPLKGQGVLSAVQIRGADSSGGLQVAWMKRGLPTGDDNIGGQVKAGINALEQDGVAIGGIMDDQASRKGPVHWRQRSISSSGDVATLRILRELVCRNARNAQLAIRRFDIIGLVSTGILDEILAYLVDGGRPDPQAGTGTRPGRYR